MFGCESELISFFLFYFLLFGPGSADFLQADVAQSPSPAAEEYGGQQRNPEHVERNETRTRRNEDKNSTERGRIKGKKKEKTTSNSTRAQRPHGRMIDIVEEGIWMEANEHAPVQLPLPP
jgi:hypothetical protein